MKKLPMTYLLIDPRFDASFIPGDGLELVVEKKGNSQCDPDGQTNTKEHTNEVDVVQLQVPTTIHQEHASYVTKIDQPDCSKGLCFNLLISSIFIFSFYQYLLYSSVTKIIHFLPFLILIKVHTPADHRGRYSWEGLEDEMLDLLTR